MNKSKLLATAFASVALSFSSVQADSPSDMEKCKIVNKDGKGLIKEHKSDCASTNSSCAGTNAAGDPNAWILVPQGQCDKINAGDYSEVSDDVKDKIEACEE